MEKLPLPSSAAPPRGRRGILLPLGIFALSALLSLAMLDPTALLARFAPLQRETIAWSACEDDTTTECGYLTVPLNYLDPTSGRTAQLALRRMRGTASRREHRGSLIVNPGG